MHTPDTDLSASPRRKGFFSRVDWAAFWTATVASFVVYFFTVAPSVTLEDAGELVTAGDHLGVPHPPGYPIWTVCAYLFARVFSFVHYLGQPDPAWAIALMSGFFAALAAGITAMLISRSGADMLDEFDRTGDPAADHARHALLGWAGGVAGSLVFAFSPVEWSQATIPEVYTLNALFLVWVFLLSYRWMRRPSDKVLWAVAFLFGLGLTNYQMLLFAIVPLVIIILLRDIGLFRDFALLAIPFLATAGILMLGAEVSQPGFAKCPPYKGYEDFVGPPLASPELYVVLVLLLVAAIAVALYVGFRRRAGNADDATVPAVVLGVIAFAAFTTCLLFPTAAPIAVPAGYSGPVFSWTMPVLVFLALLAVLWALAWFTPGGRWYAGAVSVVLVCLAVLLAKGCLLGLTHPQTGWFIFYVFLNFAFLALAWALLPRGRAIAIAMLCAEAGVAFYGYMPISSDTNPPMNWGYPRTWTGFKHALSRGQYEKLVPSDPFSPLVIDQLGSYFTDLRKQFTLLLVPLGFLPFTLWRLRLGANRASAETPEVRKSESPKSETPETAAGKQESASEKQEATTGKSFLFDCFPLAFSIACIVAALAAVDRLWNKAEAFVPQNLFQAGVGIILLCVLVGFAAVALRQIQGLCRIALDSSRNPSERIAAGLCALGASVALLVAVVGFSYALASFRVVGPEADHDAIRRSLPSIGALSAALVLFALGALAAIGFYACRGERGLALKFGELHQQWFVSLFACFAVMSFLVIVMAAPKGDLQDNFIQKVKFISSHAIFALWIGYGIVFGLATFASWIRRPARAGGSAAAPRKRPSPLLLAAVAAVVVGAPLIPIYENYCNDQLIEEMSSASQDGHDFGWQFGNYQLRGAEAIAEELSPDEEPLPNPDFPPAMTTNAVFYGGTDPGRFVPTYMIFSADVRPDVFLITQNALADNTYMDTMRDMYGDQIWMPTQRDNSNAFTTYVDDVQAGRRPNLGGISFEGGRVQVTGALAVMEINGILTEQIFKQNRDRHDFYVEESYALRWMYPYETPHGLIMKIEHDPARARLTDRLIAADTDFWDWYSRRLLATPKYYRDFTARKSFSKLRSSIAGLYTARNRPNEAERAFREAVRLYPASPESNLRLVQEVLMPGGRFAEALRLLYELQDRDPNNKRLPDVIHQIESAENARALCAKYAGTPPASLAPAIALELAEAQLAVLQRGEAAATVRSLYDRRASLSPEELFRLGALCSATRLHREAATVYQLLPPTAVLGSPETLQSVVPALINGGAVAHADRLLATHLKADNQDWRAWLELSLVRSLQNNERDAATAFLQGTRIVTRRPREEQDAFLQMVESNPQLSAFYKSLSAPRTPAGTPANP